ncbi:hypothetical protein PENSPDRAFT_655272 [Peniophora sp. CONT]|nr:hypothetical protein PENSPDRAFT_655272 [Peniophora sp. CONT]
MPQAPSHPPPYSIECSSFPPPIEAAAGSQAWAFQRAFESSREPVRWGILTTMRCWIDTWPFKGVELERERIQQAYDQAPIDLKVTLDYIITNKFPFYFKSDGHRRCYDLYRTGRIQEAETSMLPQEDFIREYNAAVEPVKDAIASTNKRWIWYEAYTEISPVSKEEVVQAYANVSDPLKVVLSWMLATGWTIRVGNPRFFEQSKAAVHEMCLNHATAHIELHAMNRLVGMY